MRLATSDGLALVFDTQDGRFTSLTRPGSRAELDAAGARLGVSLADHRGAPLLDVDGTPVSESRGERGGLRVVRENAQAGLRVIEEWTAHERHIELNATIIDTSATRSDADASPAAGSPAPPAPVDASRSRGVEACLTIPADFVGQTWYGHLHQAEVIEPDQRYQTVLVDSLDIGHYTAKGYGSHLKTSLPINLHGLNALGNQDSGLAVGMHPEAPGAYYVAYDARNRALRACFHLGIYAGHLTRPDRASMRVVLLAVDQPEWGLRSALEEYLAIFSEHMRGRLPRQLGMTVGGSYRFEHYPTPERFHINSMWNAFYRESREHGVHNLLYAWPTGYIDRGVRLRARPVAGPCAECDRSMDAQVAACLALYNDYEEGRVRFPETCDDTWAQKGCRQSPVLPTREQRYGPVRIRHLFYELVPSQVVGPSERVLRLFGKFAMYEPFVASILRGADGRYEGALSDSHAVVPVGSSTEFYTCYINGFNPDPGLRADRADSADGAAGEPPVMSENFGQLNLEIAKRATGVYGERYVYQDRELGAMRYDGVALDTVGAYLRPDFHENMLRVASYPLAYDPDTGRPVALEHLGLSAFIEQLREVLPADAPIAINGYPISGTLGRGVDIFVRELGRRYRKLPGDERPRHYYELYDEDENTRLRRVYRARMVANQRPITFWARFLLNEERARARGLTPEQMLLADMERYLPLYTAKGIYVYIQRTGLPGRDRMLGAAQDAAFMARYERHLDTVHALHSAGWQAVPHARADDPAISIDRFGDTLFTLYNTSAEDRRVRVRIEWPRVGRDKALVRVRDFETGRALPFVMDSGVAVVDEVSVPAYGARILVASSEGPAPDQ